MATFTPASGDHIRPYRGRPRVMHYPVSANQTIAIGTPVVLDSAADLGHQILKSPADPAADRRFVGFAAEAITTGAVVDNDIHHIPVWIGDTESQFIVRLADGQAIDNDDLSTEYGIVEDTVNNIWRLDKTETTAKVFRVLDLLDAAGDINGRVVAMVIAPERLYHD